jgi:hypothetical protein
MSCSLVKKWLKAGVLDTDGQVQADGIVDPAYEAHAQVGLLFQGRSLVPTEL